MTRPIPNCIIRLVTMTLGLGLPVEVLAAVVYDNTATYTGLHNDLLPAGMTDSLERGNQVTLGGTERSVTQIQVYLGVFCCGVAQFDARVRFYENDGPGGSPGTLIWDSTALPAIVDSGNPEAIPLAVPFAVPDVVVPDSFTWTVQLTNRSGNMALMGPSQYDPPAIGSAPFGYWEFDVDWSFTGIDDPPFGALIMAEGTPAIPATSTMAQAAMGFVLLVVGVTILRGRQRRLTDVAPG